MYFELFFTFFKIGLFTFGGGYAMLPLIQDEIVKHDWMTLAQLVDFISVSESTPGPFAVNISTYVGIQVGGIPGGLCATFGVVLPSFIIILLIANVYEKFRESIAVKGALSGLRPTVVGLIGATIVSVGQTVLFPVVNGTIDFDIIKFISSIVIFFVMAFLLIKKKVHPIMIIMLSAIIGIVVGYLFDLKM